MKYPRISGDARNLLMLKIQRIHNPGHSPGAIPEYLKANGVECIICGGIGVRAADLFESFGIKVIQGVRGRITDVIDAYRNGLLKEGDSMCAPGAGKGYGIDKSACDHTN